MSPVFTVANHKGGVGKSGLVFNLAPLLARRRRVLAVDTDPQASLTEAWGVTAPGKSLAEVLGSAEAGKLPLRAVIRPVRDRLDLVPADIALSATSMGLMLRMGRERVLAGALATVAGAYDLILIDTPPALDLLTINALCAVDAAGGVIVPTQAQAADVRGLALFLRSVEQVRTQLNPALRVLAVIPTFVDPRYLHHQRALDAMQRAGVPLRADLAVGRTVRIAESMGNATPLYEYDPANPQAGAFARIAEWIEECLEKTTPT